MIILAASGEFSDPSFAGVLAGVAAAEALVAGLIGTRLDRQPLVWASAGLLAAAYGLTAEWLAWETATLISITAIAGGALTTAFAIGYLRGVDSSRISMWLYPVGAAGQAAAISVIVIAAASDAPRSLLALHPGWRWQKPYSLARSPSPNRMRFSHLWRRASRQHRMGSLQDGAIGPRSPSWAPLRSSGPCF